MFNSKKTEFKPHVVPPAGSGESSNSGSGSGSGDKTESGRLMKENAEMTVNLAQEALDAYSPAHLTRITIFWWMLTIFAAIADAALMYNATHSRYSDAFGNSTVSAWVSLLSATVSLFVFWMINMLWNLGGNKK